MASNKLAVALSRNSRRIVSVLVHSFLEWVLIIFLLTNSFLSYMIRKFAIYFGLKQPCILCSRVDHLLEPVKTTDTYKDLVCEIHATEISNLSYCSKHQRFTESQEMCAECSSAKTKDVLSDQMVTNEKMSTCSCCAKISNKKLQHSRYMPFRESLVIEEIEEEKSEEIWSKANDDGNHSCSECEPQILSDVGSFYLREAAEDDSNEDEEVDGHAADENKSKVEESLHKSLLDEMKKSDQDIFSTIKQLKSELEAEQKARNKLYAELEAERNAAAIAANQTMAMITRLQEEKAAMQMEALQYQRVMEEQAEYDQDALQLLNEVVAKREIEKQELEKELDVYRERFSDYDAKEKAMLLIQKCSGNFSSSCSIDNDSDVLSIDLNRHYNKAEDAIFSKEISLVDCSKEWGAIENSLNELEEERLSIIRRLKELEEKLRSSEKQDEEMFEDEKQTNLLLEGQDKNDLDPNPEFCSQEVNLVSSCFSTSIIKSENHPKTMASVARKLLDLVGSEDDEMEDMALTNKVGAETESKRLAIEKEMEHVYGRLQALEADTEFLRHCIGSVNKGDEGLSLLQEILQHLRELRDAEICM
ncbi:myosin-binding protein 2-like [Chenopodium quinoa]|uniref:GTD-binding domain-containing protein n=1 Tax=Chenopodium quinoa TaxID=63459 RepID=A0A803LSL8_CHEQI|nr:myosin-binding protein 2-like [Chenopodium quinoa]